MVIDIINVQDFAVGEAKYHSPVSANGNRPKSSELAFKRMQAKPWQLQIRNVACCIKAGKNVTQLVQMFDNYSARVIIFIKAFQSFVADRSDHISNVTRNVTRVKKELGRRDRPREWGPHGD
jgi:hypothetical protein